MVEGQSNNDPQKPGDLEPYEGQPFNWRILMRSPAWRPPTDVYETEETMVVRVEIAGMREEDFIIELNGRELMVRGNRQDPAGRRAFHQMEIRFGEFALAIELPYHINTGEVQAVYQNGFLVISLPKMKPRQIHISE